MAEKREGVCDKYCEGCIFAGHVNGCHGITLCEYFLTTGQLRPCPAGTGCTVKRRGKKVSRWEHESDMTWQKRKEKDSTPKEREAFHRVCACCGTEFDTIYKQQIYCCKKCKYRMAQRAWNKRKKAKKGGNKHGQETA
jgi:hypothetical protein